MKLSAILVSVNIVAAMPAAANAADEAVSDKAEWLKQNLAALDKTKKSEPRKVSLSDADVQPVGKKSRLRPFVPGRKLPTRRELELQLACQQARLDERKAQAFMVEQPPSLAGQVSVFASQPDAGAYSQIPASITNQFEKLTKKTKRPAAPAIAGQVPTLPGQVAFVPASGSAIPRMPERIPEPPNYQASARIEAAPALRGSGACEQPLKPGEHMVRQTGALLVQAPVLTPDEQQMMDELLEYNKGRGDQRFVDLPGSRKPGAAQAQTFQAPVMAAPQNDAGPPPFPLNMLPEGALKQLVPGRSRPHIDAPPCYFGSWHKPVALSNLPEAGFHSNIARGRVRGKYFGHYAPVVGQGTPRLTQSKRRRFEYASSQPEIAMYPPYGH